MKTFVGIEYLAAVALIKIYEDNEKMGLEQKAKISFDSLNNYGIKVMEVFESHKLNAIVLLSSTYTTQAVRGYSDCFSLEEDQDGMKYIVLKNSITYLKKRIIAYLSIDILKALTNEKVLKVLEN